MRVLVGTRDAVAVALQRAGCRVADQPGANWRSTDQLRALGPDLLALRVGPTRSSHSTLEVIGDSAGGAAMRSAMCYSNQRAVAGIGNVFKSEILFVARHPPVRAGRSSLTDAELERLVASRASNSRANVIEPLADAQSRVAAGGRRAVSIRARSYGYTAEAASRAAAAVHPFARTCGRARRASRPTGVRVPASPDPR